MDELVEDVLSLGTVEEVVLPNGCDFNLLKNFKGLPVKEIDLDFLCGNWKEHVEELVENILSLGTVEEVILKYKYEWSLLKKLKKLHKEKINFRYVDED